jgi:hypothetical protein
MGKKTATETEQRGLDPIAQTIASGETLALARHHASVRARSPTAAPSQPIPITATKVHPVHVELLPARRNLTGFFVSSSRPSDTQPKLLREEFT